MWRYRRLELTSSKKLQLIDIISMYKKKKLTSLFKYRFYLIAKNMCQCDDNKHHLGNACALG